MVSEWANRVLGHPDASGYHEQALEIYEQLGDLTGAGVASNNLGGIAYFEGRWDDAVECYGRAIDAYHRSGDDARAANSASNLGEVLVSRGAFDEAEVVLRDAIRVLRAARMLDDLLFADIQLGRLFGERGDADAAIDHLTALQGEAAAIGQVGLAFEAAMHLASAWVLRGRDDIAMQTLDDAVADVGTVPSVYTPSLARVRAAALAASGRSEEARAEIEAGLVSAQDQGLIYEEGLLLFASIQLEGRQGIDTAPGVLDRIDDISRRLDIDMWRAVLPFRESGLVSQ